MKIFMDKFCYRFILSALFACCPLFAQTASWYTKVDSIIRTADGHIGVAISSLEENDTLFVNDNDPFPMQSVFKFPLVLAVLHQVDEGKFQLDQKIHVGKDDLLPNTWSPLREKYPDGNIDLPLRELLKYTITLSDNNICDFLFRLMGGPQNVESYIHSLGIKNIVIRANEEEMHKSWDVQFKNHCTPKAMLGLLELFCKGDILSDSTEVFLWKTMTETTTGKDRIKGLLPKGTVVAHKTGFSGTNEQGITAATNDVGIVALSNGKHFAIAVFLSNSRADALTRDRIIAEIARVAWDHFLEK